MTSADHPFSYDTIAKEYAENVDAAPYNALYERPAMLALLPQVNGARLLDAGCGSGWYAAELLARGASVDAIDASAAMVEYARQRLSGASAEHRLTLRVADLGARLPFEHATFDGIVSPLVLHYMRDWRPALAEMRRVLKPEGWLLFSTHHPSAEAARFRTRDYLATEHIVDNWEWVSRVEFFRRPLSEIFSSLADSGFRIEKLIEPIPTEEFRAIKPEAYERILQQPEFLIVMARPVGD